MTDVMDDVRRIKREIPGFIHTYGCEQASEEAFGALVRDVFIYQYTYDPPYRRYCAAKRVTPATFKNRREIPPVPVDGSKHLDLSTISTGQCEAVFMTSGTTHGGKMRGRDFHPDLEVWNESVIVPLRYFIMPDRERIRITAISPAWDVNQNSSLPRYLTKVVERCGSEGSNVFFDEHRFKPDETITFLNRAVSDGESVTLMGVSPSHLYLFDYLHEHNLTFALAPDSRLFDTSGFKSTKRDITEDQMLDELEQTLGVPCHHCANMHGITELSSQIYDQNILSWYTDGISNYLKANPAWVRTTSLDPETLTPVENGEAGVIAHYDLANWNSCIGILTEDLGHRTPDGFLLQGRAKGAEARGCSIMVDEVIGANRR